MKEILLTNSPLTTSIDDEDFNRVNRYRWRIIRNLRGKPSAVTAKINSKTVYLHIFILGGKKLKNTNIDHKDRNPLNNQKYNLREISYSDSTANRRPMSSNRGITFHKKNKKWRVLFWKDKKHYHGGYYDKKCYAIVKAISMFKELYEHLHFNITEYYEFVNYYDQEKYSPPY